MSDENTQVDEATLQEARTMGWLPLEEFKGNKDNWVDAKNFVERGRQIMPILKQTNDRLMNEMRAVTGQVGQLTAALKAAQTTISALEESHADDVKEQVEAARKDLREEIARASREGDHDALATATDKLVELNSANREAGGKDDDKGDKGDKGERGAAPEMHPEIKAWREENASFMGDRRRVALANAVAEELRANGDTRIGKAFLDAVAEEVEKTLGTKPSGTSRVSSGNGGGGRSNASGGGKSYNDLPAEAKEACDRQAKRLVGPDRAHKTIESWRTKYAQQYFAQE